QDDSLAYWKEGPYWMTLHKLWRRMAEKDYRTAAKAVYLLHRLARGTTTESWGYFRNRTKIIETKHGRPTERRNVDEEGTLYAEWLDAYADFALLRLQSFAPDLSELAAIDAETPHEDASKALEKAAKLIEAALDCEMGPDLDNDVTCDGLKLVIEDLCELWSLFQQKLELRRTLSLLEFYLEQLPTAKAVVHESHRLLKMYNRAVPKGLGGALATEMLQEQVAWIQEELADKAKASLGKSGKGSDDGGAPAPASPPGTTKPKKAAGGAGGSTAKASKSKPQPAPKTPAATAPAPKKIVSKKP
ncbi:unnamed protein product, partial [Scytosiphon promiscuus]